MGINSKKSRLLHNILTLCSVAEAVKSGNLRKEATATRDLASCADNESAWKFALTVDDYPWETSWFIKDSVGAQIASGPPSGTNFARRGQYEDGGCLAPGDYTLTVKDKSGDGLCCQFGPGKFELTVDDAVVAKSDDAKFKTLDFPFTAVPVLETNSILETANPSSSKPTNQPTTNKPSANPTNSPTYVPSDLPTTSPIRKPTDNPVTPWPTDEPTDSPSPKPMEEPTDPPTDEPTFSPSWSPTITPTTPPSKDLTELPSKSESETTSLTQSEVSSVTQSELPSQAQLTDEPIRTPTDAPTFSPSFSPTTTPTIAVVSSSDPTKNSTMNPTKNPTMNPTTNPTTNPTKNPTKNPTMNPTTNPTTNPTMNPTKNPTENPTTTPTIVPSKPVKETEEPSLTQSEFVMDMNFATSEIVEGTQSVTGTPSKTPTADPTVALSSTPSVASSERPSTAPSEIPSKAVSEFPSGDPSNNPTVALSNTPSPSPSTSPSTARMVVPMTPFSLFLSTNEKEVDMDELDSILSNHLLQQMQANLPKSTEVAKVDLHLTDITTSERKLKKDKEAEEEKEPVDDAPKDEAVVDVVTTTREVSVSGDTYFAGAALPTTDQVDEVINSSFEGDAGEEFVQDLLSAEDPGLQSTIGISLPLDTSDTVQESYLFSPEDKESAPTENAMTPLYVVGALFVVGLLLIAAFVQRTRQTKPSREPGIFDDFVGEQQSEEEEDFDPPQYIDISPVKQVEEKENNCEEPQKAEPQKNDCSDGACSSYCFFDGIHEAPSTASTEVASNKTFSQYKGTTVGTRASTVETYTDDSQNSRSAPPSLYKIEENEEDNNQNVGIFCGTNNGQTAKKRADDKSRFGMENDWGLKPKDSEDTDQMQRRRCSTTCN